MPIPYGQATVSTVGTAAGNGVSVPLSGSDAATALKQCFEGTLGNNAVGTIAVLMRMGAASADLSTTQNLMTPNDTSVTLYHRGNTRVVAAYDGTNGPIISGTDWGRGEYHLKIVEYDGTKCRAGNQRYGANGVPIDADIVWSHSSLGVSTAFDGSFNPTTFLRLLLDNTAPNQMRCHWVGNQHSLGNTEIIRRSRKYGKF